MAAGWVRRVAETHKLPSGAEAVLAPGPCMNKLIRDGVLPNPLLGAVIDETNGEFQGIDWKAQQEQLAALVCAVVVDPLVSAPGLPVLDGTVGYDDIPEDDVRYIHAWVQEGADGVATFRRESERDGSSADSEGVGSDAEQRAGDAAEPGSDVPGLRGVA